MGSMRRFLSSIFESQDAIEEKEGGLFLGFCFPVLGFMLKMFIKSLFVCVFVLC